MTHSRPNRVGVYVCGNGCLSAVRSEGAVCVFVIKLPRNCVQAALGHLAFMLSN